MHGDLGGSPSSPAAATSRRSTPRRRSRRATRPAGCSAGRDGSNAPAPSTSATPSVPAHLDAVGRHRGGGPADDDATLLVLHHNAGPGPHLSIAQKLEVYAKVFGL